MRALAELGFNTSGIMIGDFAKRKVSHYTVPHDVHDVITPMPRAQDFIIACATRDCEFHGDDLASMPEYAKSLASASMVSIHADSCPQSAIS